MSGSQRAITLTLSVRDADKVRQELEKIGPAGESAINRLDAAAKRAAGGSGGVQALATAAGQTSNGFNSFRQTVGQAGFQVQDFVVQVQAGQSALTALSQQGSQFLGVFGATGAIAGAALTIGILVTQLLTGGDATKAWNDELKKQEASFKAALDAAERWRSGLSAESERVVQLRDHYRSLSSERQQFEMRDINRSTQALAQREEQLRRQIEGNLSGSRSAFQSQLDAAQDNVSRYPIGSAERRAAAEVLSSAEFEALRAGIGLIDTFRESGRLTVEELARLATGIRALAPEVGAMAPSLRNAADSMERMTPAVREYEAASNTLNERLAATGAAAGGVETGINRVTASLLALRQAALANPTASLDAELARVQERAQALQRGGLSLFEGVRGIQQQQDAARRFAEQAEREQRDRLRATQMGPEQIDAELRASSAARTARAMELAEAQASLEEGVARAREAARAGGGASRAPAARTEMREFNELLREQQGLLRANETPYERYQRQLEELAALQDRLNEAERAGIEINGVAVRALNTEELTRATQRFSSELERAESAGKNMDDIGRSLGLTFTSAFEDAIIKGKEFREVLAAIAQDIARIILRKTITEPVGNAITGLVKGFDFGSFFGNIFGGVSSSGGVMSSASGPLYSANGNVFLGGNVVPFARGGIVQRPQMFPMANGGVGLMGEAGPEAIMPLRRDSAGRLGIAGGGGGTVIQQTINVDARGADSGVDQKIRAGVAIAVQQANARLLAEINRGGDVAKQVGRRA